MKLIKMTTNHFWHKGFIGYGQLVTEMSIIFELKLPPDWFSEIKFDKTQKMSMFVVSERGLMRDARCEMA